MLHHGLGIIMRTSHERSSPQMDAIIAESVWNGTYKPLKLLITQIVDYHVARPLIITQIVDYHVARPRLPNFLAGRLTKFRPMGMCFSICV